MQTTAIRTVANSLPQNEVILLTLLISKRYIPYTDLHKMFGLRAFLVQQNRPVRLSEQSHSLSGRSHSLYDLCRNAGLPVLFRTAVRAVGRVGGGVAAC